MRVTIFGANSMAGRMLVAQALANGFTVNAFDRQVDHFIDLDNRSNALTATRGYVFDASDVLKAVKGADAVVALLGGGKDGTDKTRSLGTRNIVEQMRKADVTRFIALGGYPILDSAEEGVDYIMDSPDFPHEQMPLAQEFLAVWQQLRESELQWTLFCPSLVTEEEGKRQYITSADHAPVPDKGQVAAGDLADSMLKELTHPKYLHRRVGISRI